MNYVNLGKNIKKYRHLKEMRQSDLAELCDCSNTYIGQIENARGVPSLKTVVKICNALEVTVDQLLKDDYEKPELVYLKEINERIGKYPVKQRILICERFMEAMDFLEKFNET